MFNLFLDIVQIRVLFLIFTACLIRKMHLRVLLIVGSASVVDRGFELLSGQTSDYKKQYVGVEAKTGWLGITIMLLME